MTDKNIKEFTDFALNFDSASLEGAEKRKYELFTTLIDEKVKEETTSLDNKKIDFNPDAVKIGVLREVFSGTSVLSEPEKKTVDDITHIIAAKKVNQKLKNTAEEKKTIANALRLYEKRVANK